MSHSTRNALDRRGWLLAAAGMVVALILITLSSPARAGVGDAFTQALEKGPLYAALAAFLGGLAASLTPCVYPMIGITVAVFGAKKARSRWHAMALSTTYVLGMAAMYTPLGVAAGLTGSMFGAVLANRWVVTGIALVFVALALSMFGAFEFVLPSSLTNRAANVGGVGYLGAFLVGLVSGVVAAPCTGPVQTGILIWIGKTQSPWLGGMTEFLFSLGLGVPFWLVGTFAVALPKSGRWMNWVKSAFGVILLVLAGYFLKNAFPAVLKSLPIASWVPIVAIALGVAGLLGGAVHLGFDEGRARSVRKLAAIAASVVGFVVAIAWLEMPRIDPKAEIAWMTQEKDALALAAREKRPVLVDFTAEWCAACKELARITFVHPDVRPELDRFVMLKVDSTNDDDPAVIALSERYKVQGLPTVILIDSTGEEKRRFTEFVEPGRFLSALREIK